MIIESKYSLGDRLKDKVTGFTGIVLGITKYGTGRLHYGISPEKVNDDGNAEWQWYDESRVFLVKSKAIDVVPEKPVSGPK